jgi:hypothetical protein
LSKYNKTILCVKANKRKKYNILKYCFIFETVYAKTEHDSLELDSLNNYSILAHAKYWIDKGELEMAVRFMNQLQGEARSVAEDWLKESKLHLETVQATQALMAFANDFIFMKI